MSRHCTASSSSSSSSIIVVVKMSALLRTWPEDIEYTLLQARVEIFRV